MSGATRCRPVEWLALMLLAWVGVGAVDAGATDLRGSSRIASIVLESTAPVDRRGLLEMVPLRVGDPFAAVRLEEVQRLLACGFSTLASGDHCVRAPYGNATRGDSEAVMVPRGSGVPYAHDPGAENRIV